MEDVLLRQRHCIHISHPWFYFRDLVEACGKALDINRLLIKPDQVAYHQDLEEHYLDLRQKVSTYLSEVSINCCYILYSTNDHARLLH